MKKIAFIINKSSEAKYRECIDSIRALKKTFQHHIRVVPYTAENGDASDIYMIVQQQEKPDISVILNDTVLLVNENLLKDIDKVFLSDSSVGIIGIKGAEYLPDSSNMDDAASIYGGMYETDSAGDVFEKKYCNCQSDYVPVEVVGSTLVAVKGYIPIWQGINSRSIGEIFSVAAAIQGYKAVVPKNSYRWCYSTVSEPSKTLAELEYIGQKFKFKRILCSQDHYLLTIGIPTYNRVRFFSKCIENVYRTVGDMPWIEVFVSNNDSTDNTEDIASQYLHHKNFRYYKQPVNIVDKNFSYLYENARGDFVVACGDDDYYSPDCILNLLETICLYPDTTIIELGWGQHGNLPIRQYGSGIDDFLTNCGWIYTCISCIVLNHERYLKVEVKDRFSHTHLNQCYIQLDMMRKGGNFIVLNGNLFLPSSGEAVRARRFHKDKRLPFCGIFIGEHYSIINYFLDKGLSKEAYEKAKKMYLKNIFSWLRIINQAGDTIRWLIDDDIEDIMKENFGYEPYYDELQKELAQILE